MEAHRPQDEERLMTHFLFCARMVVAVSPSGLADDEEGTMFMLRHRVYATLGKEAEVRDFMTGWVRHAQEQGEKVALVQRIFSSEGPVLVVARRYEDLVTLDERRRANQADADWQARVAKLSAMI